MPLDSQAILCVVRGHARLTSPRLAVVLLATSRLGLRLLDFETAPHSNAASESATSEQWGEFATPWYLGLSPTLLRFFSVVS